MLSQIKIILRGISQVFLIENALTGLLFLTAVTIGSWKLALGTIVGTIISTIAAIFFKASKEDINIGLYGFNGALVGLATCFLYGFNIFSYVAVFIGSIISTSIMKMMKTKFRPLTSPYILTVWIIALINYVLKVTTRITPGAIKPIPKNIDLIYAVPRNIGQVMFQGSIYSGFIFLLGLFIANRIAGIYAIYGSLIAVGVAYIIHATTHDINIGLLGFNAVLCAIALGDKNKQSFIIATTTCSISTILFFLLAKTSIFVSTSPFVLVTWMSLFFQSKLKKQISWY